MSPSGFGNELSHMIFLAFSLENEKSFIEAIPCSYGDEFDSSVQIDLQSFWFLLLKLWVVVHQKILML